MAAVNHLAPLVAIVDDEASVCRALVRLLNSANYRARAYSSAAQFLSSLPEHSPDCIVLDLQMPVITGIDVQQHLLKLNQHVPVIVMTAYDEPGTLERCLALGATTYLRKPIEGEKLIGSIRDIVGGPVERQQSDPPARSS